MLARGKSYRAKDIELVQFDQFADQTKQIDQAWARLDTHDQDGNVRTVKLQCSASLKNGVEDARKNIIGTCKKSFEIEEKTFLRLSSQKSLPVVLFEPNHLLMLSGSPELRRSYLDDLLEQLVPRFGTMRRQYKRMLAQRNALLKQTAKQNTNYYQPISSEVRSQLFVWNVRLGELAGYVVRERLALIEKINAIASDIYGEISSNDSSMVQVEYVSSLLANNTGDGIAVSADTGSKATAANYETALLRRFEQTLERDVMLGYTTAGPHRDDLQVRLNGHLSQESASRGENRTIVLALKIIELQLMASSLDVQSPILLLDDVFSELDGKRRHALTNYLKTYQTFITTTDADVVVKHFTESSNIIPTQR